MKPPPSRSDDYASASEVARLAYCERQISLDRIHGPQTTELQRQRRAEGELAHQEFHRDAVLAGHPRDFGAKRWCFIATVAFGAHAPETAALRLFRDNVLRRSRLGRAVIARYYALAPALCVAIGSRPRALGTCRAVLRWIIVPAATALTRYAARRRREADDRC